jgi:CRISPR-associated protein Csm2
MSNQPYRQQPATFPKVSDTDLRTIISGDPVASARLTDRLGEQVGRAAANIAASQIRNVFSKVRQIEMSWPDDAPEDATAMRDLILLKPKLRYQTARKSELEPLANLLIDGIDLVQDRATFQRFTDFFEAILAYHKAAGGK